eukprot:220857-Rhodomonas_salina.1
MQRVLSAGRRATSPWTAARRQMSRATRSRVEIMPLPPSARRTGTASATTITRTTTAATVLASATTRSPTSSAEALPAG